MSYRGPPRSDGGQSSLPPGTQLNGTYEIGDLISSGGMGEVYTAHNIATGDPVAIKVVLPEYAADQLILDLFRKEARILYQLAHEAIVRYYGFASDRSINRSYMAMEFVEGPSLADQMKVAPLNSADVASLKTRLADGLYKAHELGIIHRDISPENVILQGGLVSRAKIIDFGIAKSTALASEGTLIGTTFAGRYNFASPEQVGMFRPATVSPKSDIYSLGLVLAAALRGTPIDMSGTMAEIMEKRMSVPDLSDIPEEMGDLLTAMLEPNPGHRIASMADVRDWVVKLPDMASPRGRRGAATGPATQPDSAARGIASKRPPPPARQSSKTPPKLQSTRQPPRDEPAKSRAALWIALAVAGVIAAGAGGGWYYVKSKTGAWQQTAEQTPSTPAAPPPPAEEQHAETPPTETPAAETPAAETPAGGSPPEQGAEAVSTEVPAKSSQTPVAGESMGESAEKTPAPAAPGQAAPEQAGAVLRTPSDVTAFITSYDGGDCFFARARDVKDGSARISGFGTSTSAFTAFDDAFKRAAGYEASINVQQVTEAQCPAVDAIEILAGGAASTPELLLLQQTFMMGGNMLAEMSDSPGRHLELVYINHAGKAFKLTSYAKRDSESGKYAINVRIGQSKPSSEQFPLPQLVLAISSPEPLKTLTAMREGAPTPSDWVFPELLKEAEQNGKVSVAVQYFQLEAPGG